jgi:hypothetical protein
MLNDSFRASDGVSQSNSSNGPHAVPISNEDFETIRARDRDFEALRAHGAKLLLSLSSERDGINPGNCAGQDVVKI